MDVRHIIIHELHKQSGQSGAQLTTFDSTIDHRDEKVVKLIQELNNRYKNRSETYGIFDRKNVTEVHRGFGKYYKDTTKKNFIDFSIRASEDLKYRIDTITQAKGGYLIYAHYSQNRNYIGIFLVRNTIGLTFQSDSKHKKFNIEDVAHIDFENLAMACRINIDTYNSSGVRYLSFISKKSDEMSQYFVKWISAAGTETNEEDTKYLLQLFQRIDPPVDQETKLPFDKTSFLDKVYQTIVATPGRTVNMRTLSESFYGDPKYISDYAELHAIQINGEFKAHPATLRKFIQIKAKADNIELSFPYTSYNSSVRINKNNKDQIIIDSKNLANQLRQFIDQE